LFDAVEHTGNGVKPFVEVGQRRTERKANEVVAWRREQITTVGWINFEKDSWDYDRLFFQKFFEECQAIVEGMGQRAEIEPDIEGGYRRNGNFEAKFLKTGEDVIALMLEVELQGSPLKGNMGWVEQRNRS